MFRGANNINVDAKGRIAIPVRFRERLIEQCGGELVVTVDDKEKCLLIYPKPDWDSTQAELQAIPNTNDAVRRLQRLLIGHATDLLMDANGRLLLTPPLRQYARLEKKGVLLGQGKKLELWDEDTWVARRDAWLEDQSGQTLTEELNTFSL